MPEPTGVTFTNYANLRPSLPTSNGSKSTPIAAFVPTTTKLDDGPPPYKRNQTPRDGAKESTVSEPSIGETDSSSPSRLEAALTSASSFGEAIAPHVFQSPGYFLKLFWIIAYLGLIALFSYQMHSLVMKFLQYPVVTQITIDRESQSDFPAVTFCNNNPVRLSELQRLKNYADLASLDDYVESQLMLQISEDFGYDWDLECPTNYEECPETGECVSPQWLCDGECECEDCWDEGFIPGETGDTLDCDVYWDNIEASSYSQWAGDCLDGYIECGEDDPVCAVPCDGEVECQTGWDESADLPLQCAKDCWNKLTAVDGEKWFTSFGYPNEYNNSIECYWEIEANDSTKVVALQINPPFEVQFEGEGGERHCVDVVRFYDGTNGELLAMEDQEDFCGDIPLPPILPGQLALDSPSYRVIVELVTDWSERWMGFNISYFQHNPVTVNSTVTATVAPLRQKRDVNPKTLKKGVSRKRRHTPKSLAEKNMAKNLAKLREKRDILEGKSVLPKRKMRSDKTTARRRRRHAAIDKKQIMQNRKNLLKRKRRSEEPAWQSSGSEHWPAEYYDQWYWENYDQWYDNWEWFKDFEGIEWYDWVAVFESSTMPDYSDFRKFALFDAFELEHYGTQLEDFVVQCTFDGRLCNIANDFEAIQNPRYGNCFAFNTIMNKQKDNDTGQFQQIRSSSKTGQQYGLKVTLFLDFDNYVGSLAHDGGAQVTIVPVDQFPVPESFGITVSSGTVAKVAVRKEIVERLGGKFGPCITSFPDELAVPNSIREQWPYSSEICDLFCTQTKLWEHCKCVDNFIGEFYDPNDTVKTNKICQSWDEEERICLNELYKKVTAEDPSVSCPCEPECRSEKYQMAVSESDWPTLQYTPYLINILRKESDSARLHWWFNQVFQRYDADTQSATEELHVYLKKNFVRVEVYFQHFNFERISEKEAYSFQSLMADFGGNIGLWIGWSALVALELFVLFYNVLKGCICGPTQQ